MDIKRLIEQAVHSYGLRNVKKTGPLCYWYWADDDFIDSEPFKAMEEYASEYGEGVFFGGSFKEQTKVEQLVGIDWGFDGVAIKIVDPLAQMIDSYLDEYGYDTMATKYAQSKNESSRPRGRMLKEGREEDLSYLGDAFSKFVSYIRRTARHAAPANWTVVWNEDEDTIPEYYRDNRDFVAGLSALKTDEISCGWDNYIIASVRLTKDDVFLAIWGVEIADRLGNLNIFIAKEMRALYGKHFRLGDLKKNDIDKRSLREISNIVEDFTKETIERFPEVKTESRRPRGRVLKEDRNKNWNTVSLDRVHSRDLEDMIVDFGLRQKFLKDIMDYAVHSDSYDDEMENWSRDDVLNHFCDSDPRGYAKAVHDLAKRYWNNGELPKDEVRDWCLEQGFVLGESRRSNGRMLKEYVDEMPIPYLIGQVKYEDGWSPMVVYLNWGDDRYWYEASIIEAGGVMFEELGRGFVVSKVKPGTDKCNPKEVYAVKRHFFDSCEDQGLPVREVKTVRELGRCAPAGRELHSRD